jgi:hypothetical protein
LSEFEEGPEVYPSDSESGFDPSPPVAVVSAVEANCRPELGEVHSWSLRARPAEIRNMSKVGAMPYSHLNALG